MLNTECKQCHKKWHNDNAKYCSMCGNKLAVEPEFKIGDYIVTTPFEEIYDYRFVILDKDFDDESINVSGLWYDKENGEIKENDFSIFVDETRHATPEEIAEYKAALNFHKHGRKPFEVKEGDLIKASSGQNIIAYYPENFSKVNFLKRGWKLLKTSEEVNEWLGADDE